MKATVPKNQKIKAAGLSSLTVAVSSILIMRMINVWSKGKLWTVLSPMSSN